LAICSVNPTMGLASILALAVLALAFVRISASFTGQQVASVHEEEQQHPVVRTSSSDLTRFYKLG